MRLVGKQVGRARRLTRGHLLLKVLEQGVLLERVVKHRLGLGDRLPKQFTEHFLCVGIVGIGAFRPADAAVLVGQ